MDHIEGGSGGNVRYSLVGEAGPEVVWLNAGDYVGVSPGTVHTATPPLVSNLDTTDPDEGTAGLPAKV